MVTALSRRSRGGFTLVELLTVIAVIGILAAIIIPTVGNVRENARRSAAGSNLRQISIAYTTYATSSGRPRSISADNIYDWARTLAQSGNFNDPQIYILPADPLVEQTSEPLPRVIATPPASGSGDWTIDAGFQGYPLSFAVASRVSGRAPASTTPIAWTRGLQTSGTWAPLDSATPGVYGADGGHIAFLDGHVVFYEDLTTDGGQLIHYTTKQPTSNISEALNSGALGLDSTGSAF
jgi:prepilin-type N-terminal cleavage/methylation domain-containing protein/prepilin-type processing-associated H-X9-DG protein